MLDWDRVRVFHAVAQAGSFTRAAERLGLSQSAISRQIVQKELVAAGLQIRARRERPLLPGRCLVIAAWCLESRATAGKPNG